VVPLSSSLVKLEPRGPFYVSPIARSAPFHRPYPLAGPTRSIDVARESLGIVHRSRRRQARRFSFYPINVHGQWGALLAGRCHINVT